MPRSRAYLRVLAENRRLTLELAIARSRLAILEDARTPTIVKRYRALTDSEMLNRWIIGEWQVYEIIAAGQVVRNRRGVIVGYTSPVKTRRWAVRNRNGSLIGRGGSAKAAMRDAIWWHERCYRRED